VFKVAAVGLDASVKMSSPLLKCLVNHSLVKFSSCRHNQRPCNIVSMVYISMDTTQIGQLKSFLANYQNDKLLNFCTEITFVSRAIPVLAKRSANYE